MKLVKRQIKFTSDIAKLISYANSLGIYLTNGEAYRSRDQQYLYYNGKTIKDEKLVDCRVRSWTMRSQHLNRLAQDFNFFIASADGKLRLTYNIEDIRVLGEYWCTLDIKNNWGGFWKHKDIPHFERKN